MSTQAIAQSLERLRTVLVRRPEFGQGDDAPATARWQGGLHAVATHANGAQLETDMPAELGGSGEGVTPGWLFRAGLGSCAVTSIAMQAAAAGIELTTLQVSVHSRSDARGLFAMFDVQGQRISAAPSQLELRVRIAAHGATASQLQALVATGCKCSPIPNAVEQALPLALQVEVVSA